MSRWNTADAILGQSCAVLFQHRKLLVFPLLIAATMFAAFQFFIGPLMFHTTVAESWGLLWNPTEMLEARRAARQAGLPPPDFRHLPFAVLAPTYLLGMFAATFVNFAFYSQVISALNGGGVSIRRGFALAMARLPAIFAWALFAGTLGVLLRMVQQRLPLFGQWIVGLLGVAGSVASVFVIPVMLNEPRVRNPVDYLRISANLIKRVWGEGLAGVISLTATTLLLFIGVMVLTGIAAAAMHQYWLISVGFVGLLVLSCLQEGVSGIFRCGLYIYATEGVAPGPFDADTLNRAWTVKGRAQQS